MSTKLNEIKQLIKLMEAAAVPITELEISDETGTVRVSCQTTQAAHVPLSPQLVQASLQTSASTQTEDATLSNDKALAGTPVNAPMVGTVYLSPSPGAEPFVKVGQTVKAGTPLCLIEAMKMFNKIDAEVSGVVTACLIEDAQPVEFGQPLFMVDTTHDK